MQLSISPSSARDRQRWAACHTRALDTLETFTDATRAEDIEATIWSAVEPYGIDNFIAAGLRTDGAFEDGLLLNHWRKDWFDLYTKQGFFADDPVAKKCFGATMPFEWTEARFDPEREPRAQRVMNLARDFGLVQGMVVPLHAADGFAGCLSFSGARPDFDPGVRAALHLISIYAIEHARRLTPGAAMPNPLTAREREVLTWAAVGKSHVDVADILAISERTVTAHMVSATRKLGASNRTHAVVKAMQARFIRV